MMKGIEDLRARWERADQKAHEAENMLLAAKLVAGPAGPDPQVALTALELRAEAEHLRLALEALGKKPD
jgi:hypothetical protein